MRNRYATTLTAVAFALALGACSADDPDDGDGDNDPAPAVEETTAPATDGVTVTDSGAGVVELDGAEVVAEATYTLPGSQNEVTVGVLPLEVAGDVMTLRLAFTPNFATASANEPVAVYDMYPDNTFKFRPVLIDRENLKEYSLISETGQDWSARELELKAVNGDTVFWWGVYAAPEDDVETFDLRVRDSIPEFTDIPVQ